MYFCLYTSVSSPIKNTFCLEVVLKYSPLFGMLIEQRLHGLQFQKVKVFPLQQPEILKQNDLVFEVGYQLLEMKRLLFLEVRSIDLYIGLPTLRAACCY